MNSEVRPTASYSEQQRLEAAEWFLDIHDAQDPSPEMLQHWVRWLNASEGNRLAFQAVERTWHETPTDVQQAASAAETPSDDRDDEDYDTSMSVAEWRRSRAPHLTTDCRGPSHTTDSAGDRRGHPAERLGPLARLVSSISASTLSGARPLRSAAAVATIVAVAMAAWWVLGTPGLITHPSVGEFVTHTGEHMELTLADGSRVSLGARSQLSVAFTRETREVQLKAGEAFFSVHKDPRRPFRVHALGGVITAVGTAFDVRAIADRVTVIVAEGSVSIANSAQDAHEPAPGAPSAQRSSTVRLSRGEQLTFTTRARTAAPMLEDATLTRVDPKQPARWREGWLVYRAEPLRYVIADVGRYADSDISVADSVGSELRFTGAVSKDSVVEWVEALPEVFPVSVETTDRGLKVTTRPVTVTAENP